MWECLELPREDFADFRAGHPHVAQRNVHSLALVLAKSFLLANTKIDVLSA
jgi:hypothetical protein